MHPERQKVWRETPTKALLRLLIGRIIVFRVGKTLFAILIGELLFSLVKNIVRSSDWLKLIWSENFLTKFFIE